MTSRTFEFDDPSTSKAGVNTIRLFIAGAELAFDIRSVRTLAQEIATTCPPSWSLVITPNLNICRTMQANPRLRRIISSADTLLPDGWPIAWLLSREADQEVTRASGADLMEELLRSDGGGRPLVLVGGSDPTAMAHLAHRAQAFGWRVHLEPAPPEELENHSARTYLLERVSRAGRGGVVVVGLGVPKQEYFADHLAQLTGFGWVLCLGMALNYSSGVNRRAPELVQRMRLEWFYRAASEPRRLVRRYAADAAYLLRLVGRAA